MSFLKENRVEYNRLMARDWVVDGKTYNLRVLGWYWGYNTHKRSLGTCSNHEKRIEISSVIFELNPDFKLLNDTIRHEIAHAIDYTIRGKSDHSYKWKNIALQVGCDASRTSTIEKRPKGKYTLVCPNGHKLEKYRRPKDIKRSCGLCSSKYDERYLLKTIQNY